MKEDVAATLGAISILASFIYGFFGGFNPDTGYPVIYYIISSIGAISLIYFLFSMVKNVWINYSKHYKYIWMVLFLIFGPFAAYFYYFMVHLRSRNTRPETSEIQTGRE